MASIYKDARADIIQEFLEVSFHSILFTRGIYPHALFQSRRKYNIPVKMCCHPELNQYIKDALQTIHLLLLQDAVEKVDLLLIAPDRSPLDCYSFLVQNFTSLQQPDTVGDTNFIDLEDSFRAGLLKINVSDTITQTTLPPNSSFLIHVHTSKQAAASLYHDQEARGFPWVETDSTCSSAITDSIVVPLKTIDVGWLKMNIQLQTSWVVPK